MIPIRFERAALLILLLLAVWFRGMDFPRLPLGFSNDELTHIDITEQVRDGNIRVFFANPTSGGHESLYNILNTGITALVGDGLVGYRLLGLWSGLLALAFLYAAVRALFGPGIALVSLAIMVTGISSILNARNATPLVLAPLGMSATLAAIVWTFRLHKPIAPVPPHTAPYTILAFVVAAALYTHYTGIFLALIVLILVVYLRMSGQPVSRQVWSSSLFVLTLILVLAFPYLISFFRNPDSTGIAIFWQQRPLSFADLGDSFISTLAGIFRSGDSNPSHNVPSLPLLFPLWVLLALVGLFFAARRWREPGYALTLIFLIVGLLPDIWLRNGPDFNAMVILRPTLTILAGIGTYAAARFVQSGGVMGGWRFVALLAALTVGYTAWQAQDRLLDDWQNREDVQATYHTDVGRLAAYLDTSDDRSPTLICVDILNQEVLPTGQVRWAEPDIARYAMHRDNLELRFATCRSAFVFINGGEPMRVALVNPRSLSEATPAIRLWFDRLQRIDAPNLPPGVISEIVAVDELAELAGQLTQSSPLFYPRIGSDLEPAVLPARFGRNVTLLGYEPLGTLVYQPGNILSVTSYWRIDGTPPERLGVFTRLHDTPQSSPYTETNTLDALPATLRERDVVIQTNFMTIPETLLPGEYVVTIGAYDNNPLNQIPVFGAEAAERGNYLMLEPRLTVESDEGE
jgi:4-amino-4-deoxy-L-arabinose transferase-like glycosyltransferase